MSSKQPLSYTLVERYQDYRVALETVYMVLGFSDEDPLEHNPFILEEAPRRYNLYNAIINHGAVNMYHMYCLDENTLNQFILDDVRYSKEHPGDFVPGSDAHLDYILRTQNTQKDHTHIPYKDFDSNRDCLDFVAPMVQRWAIDNKDEQEQETHVTALTVDSLLNHPLPYALEPEKSNAKRMRLSAPKSGTFNPDHLITQFYKKLAL
jgi:hypothetical protein